MLVGIVLIGIVLTGAALAQPSAVVPGPNLTLRVDGAPFYPLGWAQIGACHPGETTYAPGRASVLSDLEALRGTGTNTILEPPVAGGRLFPLRLANGWWNWKSYTFYRPGDNGEALRAGHPRAGAYAEALLWLMDHAAAPPCGAAGPKVYVLPTLMPYVTPGYEAEPYGGSDRITCAAFAETIEEERRQHTDDLARAARIPVASCTGAPATLPHWEWTLRYIVHSLRDHPALLGWYLWDEPEGNAFANLFGVVPPGEPIRPFTGPESLPTPDLLDYAYRRVIDFETEGRDPEYRRHPVLVDVRAPETFFSDRFAWSKGERRDPRYTSGPFDRRPDGSYATPADVLGLEASSIFTHTRAAGDLDRHAWYWDQNYQSITAAMLREAAERDRLWSAFVVHGQAMLPNAEPFAVDAVPTCGGASPRVRVLNDRDLVWSLLTSQIDGMRGFVYVARGLIPAEGIGGAQRDRTDRLRSQFIEAGLADVFTAEALPEGSRWRTSHVRVEALTNYFRQAPSFVGSAEGYDPGRSAFSRSFDFASPDGYRADRFGRTSGGNGNDDAYGHATPTPRNVVTNPAHRLLRTALFRRENALYFFASNAFDARIRATVTIDAATLDRRAPFRLDEGSFDLGAGGRFAWTEEDARNATFESDTSGATLVLDLEPYEARFFRLQPTR